MKPYRLPVRTQAPKPKGPGSPPPLSQPPTAPRAPLTFEVWAGTNRDHVTVVARAATRAAGVAYFLKYKATPVKGRGLALVKRTRTGTYSRLRSFKN